MQRTVLQSLSVCPSDKRVLCDKAKETCAHILIPHEWSFIPVFWQKEWLVEADPSICNVGANWLCWSENADFQSMFARSASAVTPSEKSSININKKYTTSFPMSPRWTVYVPPEPSKEGLKKRKVSKIWTIICDNFETVRGRMPVSINHIRRSHTGFRLVPTSVTLNDFERRNSRYFALFRQIR